MWGALIIRDIIKDPPPKKKKNYSNYYGPPQSKVGWRRTSGYSGSEEGKQNTIFAPVLKV